MNAMPADTTLEAARKEFEVLRKLGPEVRAEMAFELSGNLRDLVEAGVRQRHPDFSEKEVKREFLRPMIGEKLFGQVSEEIAGQLAKEKLLNQIAQTTANVA